MVNRILFKAMPGFILCHISPQNDLTQGKHSVSILTQNRFTVRISSADKQRDLKLLFYAICIKMRENSILPIDEVYKKERSKQNNHERGE